MPFAYVCEMCKKDTGRFDGICPHCRENKALREAVERIEAAKSQKQKELEKCIICKEWPAAVASRMCSTCAKTMQMARLAKDAINKDFQSKLQEALETFKMLQDTKKQKEGKTRWSLLPWSALREVAKAFEDGVKPGKYQVDDWKKLDSQGVKTLYFDAAIRHLTAYMQGETHAQDSGVHHLGHAAANVLIMLWHAQKESK